jgi:hypothetical protein
VVFKDSPLRRTKFGGVKRNIDFFKISVEALFFRNDFLARTAVSSNIIHGMKGAISL